MEGLGKRFTEVLEQTHSACKLGCFRTNGPGSFTLKCAVRHSNKSGKAVPAFLDGEQSLPLMSLVS